MVNMYSSVEKKAPTNHTTDKSPNRSTNDNRSKSPLERIRAAITSKSVVVEQTTETEERPIFASIMSTIFGGSQTQTNSNN